MLNGDWYIRVGIFLVVLISLSACSDNIPKDLGLIPIDSVEFRCLNDTEGEKSKPITDGIKSYRVPKNMTFSYETLIKYFDWNASNTFSVAAGEAYYTMVDDQGRPFYRGNLCFGNLQINGTTHIRENRFLFNEDTIITYKP